MHSDKIIGESELILHPDGSVYHLKIRPEHLAPHLILVGDPGRVMMVSDCFDSIEFKGSNREFIVHTGYVGPKRLTVMSTGMGTDNMDIVMNELDALVNIDLETRQIREKHTTLNLFRLGTSGSLQADLPLNAVVLSAYGLGIDGMLWYYDLKESNTEKALREAIVKHTEWDPRLPRPYVMESSATLMRLFDGEEVYRGITVTAPGFYGPQGRALRLSPAHAGINDKLETFSFEKLKILNYEMETSAFYGLSKLLGHQAITLCLSIANRRIRAVNKDYHPAMQRLIEKLLSRIGELKG
jgi:uridine phosphorylase